MNAKMLFLNMLTKPIKSASYYYYCHLKLLKCENKQMIINNSRVTTIDIRIRRITEKQFNYFQPLL